MERRGHHPDHLILTPGDAEQLADFMEQRADRRGTAVEEIDRGAFMTPYELKLAPLPCWQHLPTAAVRKKVAQMVAEIEEEAAAEREKRGTEPLGMENIRGQDPLRRPVKSQRSPKPLCHAASREMRKRTSQHAQAL